MRRRTEDKETVYHQRAARRDAFIKLGMIFLGILLIADTVQIARFGEIVERVDLYNKGVVDELGGFREDIMAFGNDMNEMRGVLLLPEKKYSFMEEDESAAEADTKETSPTEQALYTFLSSYVSEKDMAAKAALSADAVKAMAASETFAQELDGAGYGAAPLEDGEFSVSFKINSDDVSVFAVTADKKTGELKIQSAAGSYLVKAAEEEEIEKEILAYVIENGEKIARLKQDIDGGKGMIENLFEDEEIKKLLDEKNLTFNPSPAEDDKQISYSVLNVEEEALLTVSVNRADASLVMNEKSYSGLEEFKSALLETLKNLDGATSMERMIAEQRAELENVFKQEAFADLLKNSGLEISAEPREEYNKLLYDVKNENGDTVFSFVIELSSGYLKILKDNEEVDLYSALQDGSKKKS